MLVFFRQSSRKVRCLLSEKVKSLGISVKSLVISVKSLVISVKSLVISVKSLVISGLYVCSGIFIGEISLNQLQLMHNAKAVTRISGPKSIIMIT